MDSGRPGDGDLQSFHVLMKCTETRPTSCSV